MKYLAYILLLVMLSSSLIPCDLVDGCSEEDHTEQSSQPENDKGCSGCPPFAICSAERGVTTSIQTTTIDPGETTLALTFFDREYSILSEYRSSLFQPPRAS